MRTPFALSSILILALGCTSQERAPSGDSIRPDTSAIRGAGSAPHPTPAEADTMSDSTTARDRDSAARTRRP